MPGRILQSMTSTPPSPFASKISKRKHLRDFAPQYILPPNAPVKVTVLIHRFDRRKDLSRILRDIANQHAPGVTLDCVVIARGSNPRLSSTRIPAGLRVEYIRVAELTSGPVGLNRGLHHILSRPGLATDVQKSDFIWFVDGNTRATKTCLHHLVRVLRRRPDIGLAGSALFDTSTHQMYECGANVLRKDGQCWPASWGDVDRRFLVNCDYLSASSALVRREAIEQSGVRPENFIRRGGVDRSIEMDETDWAIQIQRKTGLRCVGVPRSRAFHPPPDRRPRKSLKAFQPDRVLALDESVKVAALIPCFNRRDDLELILKDIAAQVAPGVTLWCVVVDNGSKIPLSSVPVPRGLRVEFVRSEKNTGGSGGFNLGMSHILSGSGMTGEMGKPDFLWWVDSDARAPKTCLHQLVRVMRRRPDVGAAGSALYDTKTLNMYECGGNVLDHDGNCCPAARGDLDRRTLIECDYLAACSALVRREAIEFTGLFPDNFIYHDDVDWALQMRRKTGLICVGVPRSRAFHPPFDRRFRLWGRYYVSRNCFSTLAIKGLGPKQRYKRAICEIPRAIGQSMMGLGELAELHLRGFDDALHLRFPGLEPGALLKPLGFRPFTDLPTVIRELTDEAKAEGRAGTLFIHPHLHKHIPGFEVARTILRSPEYKDAVTLSGWRHRALYSQAFSDVFESVRRLFTGGTADIAVVTTGWPTNWFRARRTVQICSEGIIVRNIKFWPTAWAGMKTGIRGYLLAARLAVCKPYIAPLPPAPKWNPMTTNSEPKPIRETATAR